MNKTNTRTQAIVLAGKPYTEHAQSKQLGEALHEDLNELLGAVKLRAPAGNKPLATSVQLESALTSADSDVIVVWADTAAMPLHAVAGALDALSEAGAVVGPCASGDVYLLGFAGPINKELAADIASVLFDASPLEALTDLLDELEIETAVLPPWFKINSPEQLFFAENLARLSLLSEDGEDDFIADRLRVWFEENAED